MTELRESGVPLLVNRRNERLFRYLHLKSDPIRHGGGLVILAITKTIAAGCDGDIAKPVDTRGLAKQIATFLGASR